MSQLSIVLPQHLIIQLQRDKRIKPVSQTHDLRLQETLSLRRLRAARSLIDPRSVYINAYDRLFRHISLTLLSHNCALSDHQPHQTLRSIASLYKKPSHVSQMIALRHRLKKTDDEVDSAHYHSCLQTLSSLLAIYDPIDSQACQKQQTARRAL